MVPIGSNISKTMSVLGLEKRKRNKRSKLQTGKIYIKERIFLAQSIKNVSDQASMQKKNGRTLSWNLSKVSINFSQSKITSV